MNETQTAAIKISGVIDRFIYHNQENGYAVCVVTIEQKQSITAAGILPHTTAGQEVELFGQWVMHKKFGRQFSISQCVQKIPSSITGLKKYLGSGLIKGIGKSYAEKLVDHFGEKILQVIEEHPRRLQEVAGIGEKRAELITQSFFEHKEVAHIMVFLQGYGISSTYAAKIYKQYRARTIDILKENPYRLADEVWGIGFKLADEIALKLGFQKDTPKRICAGIVYALQLHAQSGHSYILQEELIKKAIELLESDMNIVTLSLEDLLNQERIKQIVFQEKQYCALMTHYKAERDVAQKLRDLISYQHAQTIDSAHIYSKLLKQKQGEIALNDDQQRGIMTIFQQKVTVITGGPGTGKTTLIRKLLSIIEEEKISYKLAAPTGRAAKRITEQTGRFATTLHRLLEIDPQTFTFVHNESNALKLQMLIVDESSMIDIFLANSLLKALPMHASIVFLGDIDQLPSVGPGNFLADCLASKTIARIRLTHIFRQAQNSLITLNAHRIITGQPPVKSSPDTRNDFIFINEADPENLFSQITSCYKKHFKTYGITQENSVILTPMNRGIAGNFTLNHHLQQFLNGAAGKSVSQGNTVFKVQDKVMQIRNNYEKLVFNGDCGTVEDIDHQEETVTILFGDKQILYGFDELHELILAYSMTIHKSQGSEYDAVIIPLFMQHYMLLARNLLYTAITRAKKLCIIIGQPKAVHCALAQARTTQRITFLTHSIDGTL
ncbi:MAG: ATP-dependent RecD-like DNA helicase [Candidatus Babeliaceae bacterium]|nr:ATP-dependent RecD-like DNA helicase [Candidatus Babeliaceae bacterium]